jgi:hypothetical protein
MKLYIRTKSGSQYHITEGGFIVRLDIAGFKPSGEWKMRGLVHVRYTRYDRVAITLSQLRRAYGPSKVMPEAKPALLYKNGKPQWYIADTDHGTNRVMCDGVIVIRKV